MPTVLVVEDDRDARQLEQIALEQCGYCVLTAANGLDAWPIVDHHRPHVIVLDLMMPIMDGLTFLAQRQRPDNAYARAIPVICVSAAGNELTAEAIKRGAVICLGKPTDLDQLCDAVDRLCGRRWSQA